MYIYGLLLVIHVMPRVAPSAGTVLYSHACSLQEALLAGQEEQEAAAAAASSSLSGRHSSSLGPGSSAAAAALGSSGRGAAERAIQATFAHAAQYIALAYAMEPGKGVYGDSLAAVQRLLPLPHLRAGCLLAVHPDTECSPSEQWVPCWFGLGLEGLQAARPPAAYAGSAAHSGMPAAPLPIRYELADVADARLAADPSLPAGAAIWLGLRSSPRWGASCAWCCCGPACFAPGFSLLALERMTYGQAQKLPRQTCTGTCLIAFV